MCQNVPREFVLHPRFFSWHIPAHSGTFWNIFDPFRARTRDWMEHFALAFAPSDLRGRGRMVLDLLAHFGDPRGRNMSLPYLFRRAARLARRMRSAPRRVVEIWRNTTRNFLPSADFRPRARCAFGAQNAQRASHGDS